MDIYNLSGFKWWCKQRRNSSFLAIIIVAFIIFVLGDGLISSLKPNNTSIDKEVIILLVVMAVVFVIVLSRILRTVIRNMNIKVEEYGYGIITNFYVKRHGSASNRKRRLYIVANVNGKELDAQCMPKTYRKANQGQQVIVFRVKGDNHLYCVHPEM